MFVLAFYAYDMYVCTYCILTVCTAYVLRMTLRLSLGLVDRTGEFEEILHSPMLFCSLIPIGLQLTPVNLAVHSTTHTAVALLA